MEPSATDGLWHETAAIDGSDRPCCAEWQQLRTYGSACHSARWWSATELPGTGSATSTRETVTAYGGRVASVKAVTLPPNGLRCSICEMSALWDSVPEESPHIPPAELRSTVRQPFFEGILAAKAGVDGGDALSGPHRPIPCGGWPVACSSTLVCTSVPSALPTADTKLSVGLRHAGSTAGRGCIEEGQPWRDRSATALRLC